jgi:hypothetical protein
MTLEPHGQPTTISAATPNRTHMPLNDLNNFSFDVLKKDISAGKSVAIDIG